MQTPGPDDSAIFGRMRIFLFIGLTLLPGYSPFANTDSLSPRSRKVILLSGTTGLTAGSLVYLNQAWYQQYNTGRFTFFNDNSEWLQMDKAGHVYTTFQMSRLLYDAFLWAGYSRNTSLAAGNTVGFAYLTAVEVMDGFSRGWGFSWGDELANAAGTSLSLAQQLVWDEHRLSLKFTYAPSGLAQYNPPLLGNSFPTRLLKDYNAQTYWLSFNPFVIAGRKERKYLPWLNFSIGYGAWGMLGGHENRITAVDAGGNALYIERGRRLYFSLDLDLTRIPVRSVFLKRLFSVLNMVKVPAPALGLGGGRTRFHIL
jgi:hypothetical protein